MRNDSGGRGALAKFLGNFAKSEESACMLLFVFLRGAFLFTATPRTRKEFLPRQSLLWLRGRTIGALRAVRHTLTSAEWTSCSACHELLCSRAFLFIVLRSAQHPQIPRFNLANTSLPPESFRTCFICATHAFVAASSTSVVNSRLYL